jgi:hypothetical protein
MNLSETRPPLISTGNSAAVAAVVRTSGQVLTPAFVLQGLRVFDLWEPSGEQTDWLLAFGAILTVAVQWTIERIKGRKLIGATPPPRGGPPVVAELVDAAGHVVADVVADSPEDVEDVVGTVITDQGDIVGAVGPIEDEPDPS